MLLLLYRPREFALTLLECFDAAAKSPARATVAAPICPTALFLTLPPRSIASRGDLAKPQAVAFGAVDAKVTSYSMANKGAPSTFAICGPTHVQQPIFSWAPNFSNITHDGVPASFPFDWVEMPVAPPSK